jgi:uncharacterized protein YbjT (DUF2867 family)
MTSKKLIAVAGVTGNTGSAAAETVLDRGARLRVLVRNEEKGRSWKERGAEVAVADLTDGESLAKALSGADAAYLMTPPDLMAEDPMANRKMYVRAITEGVKRSGVPHVAYLSSIAAQHSEGTGLILSSHAAEKALEGLETATTFVRAAYFIENWAGFLQQVTSDGVLPTMWSPSSKKIPQVATRDIGRVAAETLLEEPRGRSRIIELGGPEELSADDVAAILSDLLGREIRATVVPTEAQVATFTSLGFPTAVAEMFAEMYGGVESGKVDWEGGDAEPKRGTTTVREVLQAILS